MDDESIPQSLDIIRKLEATLLGEMSKLAKENPQAFCGLYGASLHEARLIASLELADLATFMQAEIKKPVFKIIASSKKLSLFIETLKTSNKSPLSLSSAIEGVNNGPKT